MRPEKNFIIEEIKSRVDRTPFVLLTDYTGMQVPQFNELRNAPGRRQRRAARGQKHAPAPRSSADSNLPDLESFLHGQSAVVMGDADVSAAAKDPQRISTAEFQKPKSSRSASSTRLSST